MTGKYQGNLPSLRAMGPVLGKVQGANITIRNGPPMSKRVRYLSIYIQTPKQNASRHPVFIYLGTRTQMN